MPQTKSSWLTSAVLAIAAGLSLPAAAQSVEAGVEAWTRGDYAAAVSQWQGPAAAGDPDAMFNLGQAYRLGRGVPMDMARAEGLYERAAQAGHVQAADTYGLMLFQDGRREAALPFVQAAARRGDPRARYLLGIAHFNGDLVPRDWERAYALLSLAQAAGLPNAQSAITEMDQYMSLEQRQIGVALARVMEDEAVQARSAELAAFDLGTASPPRATSAPPARPAATPQVPRPIPTVAVSPSIAAAQDAVNQARQATGTEDPGQAGASFANSSRPAMRPAPTPAPTPAPVTVAAAPTPSPTPAPARDLTSGPWRVQLGAFGVQGNAERLWERLSSRSELRGRERLLVPSGRVTRLLAGGFATQAEAQAACSSLQRAGQDCLVTRN